MKFPSIEEKIPEYLHPFISKQDYNLYTPMDHAGWRYIQRVSRHFFPKHAYSKYLQGLDETGISLDQIPRISEMDEKLSQFGWRAVAVVGFIPPQVFMEFLSLGVLPIACDMRRHEHLAYTPAPDIVHEAAGHAPIIADSEYADYLHAYGEISRKVIFSKHDLIVYDAIRELSDLKEDPSSTKEQLELAQLRLDRAIADISFVSEATILSRMGWWTFEYGLIGNLKDPKIYGAGLLSSIGESYHCLSDEVKKVPFTMACIEQTYDITKPQPQLFVTPDFKTLTTELEKLGSTMAYVQGGMESLKKAIQAETVTTSELDTGAQISGVLNSVVEKNAEPIYLSYEGPVQLSFKDTQISGQGADYHCSGYGTPIGKVQTESGYYELSQMTDEQIKKLNGKFHFESGVEVVGRLTKIYRELGLALVLTFTNAKATYKDQILFDPAWGDYDIICGEKIISVFGGPADRSAYLKSTGGFKQKPVAQKTNLTEANRSLNSLYGEVAKLRSLKTKNTPRLKEIYHTLKSKYPHDWLLRLEILEFSEIDFKDELLVDLKKTASKKEFKELVSRGLQLMEEV